MIWKRSGLDLSYCPLVLAEPLSEPANTMSLADVENARGSPRIWQLGYVLGDDDVDTWGLWYGGRQRLIDVEPATKRWPSALNQVVSDPAKHTSRDLAHDSPLF